LRRGVARAGKEIVEHPVETVAILTTALAAARLVARREKLMDASLSVSTRRRNRLAPIALMAAICAVLLTGCAMAAPTPPAPGGSFASERADPADQATTGEVIARESCMGCHPRQRKLAYAGPPALAELMANWSGKQVAEALAAGSPLGHEGMPRFAFSAVELAALAAYQDGLPG
jgi:mono/diheme cytochrome c family protein